MAAHHDVLGKVMDRWVGSARAVAPSEVDAASAVFLTAALQDEGGDAAAAPEMAAPEADDADDAAGEVPR